MATQNFKRNLFLKICIEKGKNITLVCFLLPLKREIKMSDTCSLFPPFGDPWPSCLLPSQRHLVSLFMFMLLYVCFRGLLSSVDFKLS